MAWKFQWLVLRGSFLVLTPSLLILTFVLLQDQIGENRQRCQGMYSQQAWGGPVDPFILLKFLPYEGDQDPVVSLVIFEWKDEDLIGVYASPDATQVRSARTAVRCVSLTLCTESWYLRTTIRRGRILRRVRHWRVYPVTERNGPIQESDPHPSYSPQGRAADQVRHQKYWLLLRPHRKVHCE